MSNESLKPFPVPAVLGELEHVNRELDFVKMLRVKQENQPLDDIEIRAAALSLSTIYNGIEKVIIFVLKSLGSEILSGRNWHSVYQSSQSTQSLSPNTAQSRILKAEFS